MPELNGPPMTTPMLLLDAIGQKARQRLLLEQRVAAGEQEHVEIAVRAPDVSAISHSLTPAPIALIAPLLAQLRQRLVAALHEFANARVGGRLRCRG